ncbi:HlyD family secretion protein [Chitinophaga sp. Hz27]|uniref:HlyD family secretion protein n=1 Tax=Chitinophaga sp. Hz27 TaxID=3347169 RepID=UPI0035D5942D
MPEDNHIIHAEDAATLHNSNMNTTASEWHSDEVEDIIGQMPSWIIRRGVVLVGILLAGVFIGAYFLKYPDVVPARVTISSANPPVKLVARNSLPIQHLYVHNNELVASNTVLCVLANPANYKDLETVEGMVQEIDTTIDLHTELLKIKVPTGLQLGDLQYNYTELYQAIEAYYYFYNHDVYTSKIRTLTQQASYYGQLNRELGQKEQLLQEQLKLQHNRFKADSSLLTDKVISRMEFEESRKKMLDQQMNTQSNKSNIIQNNLQQEEYQKNITETTLQKHSEENNLLLKIREAAKRFAGAYSLWEQNYVIKSPISGKVNFFKYWKENQFVQTGEGVVMIIPPTQAFVVRGNTGINGSGKIKPGQQVLIKLTAYPFEEYGMLRGKMVSRSMVAMDSTFEVEINLDNGLVTNAGKTIPVQPQLEGVAEILTDDKSILQRLFESVYGKWRR